MSEFDDASFDQYVKAEIAKRDAEIERLKREIAELKKQKGISSVYEGLSFQDRQGIYTDEKGQGFCPTCLDREKRRPLKSELPWGWRCSADHNHYFSNPDSPTPQVIHRRPGRI